MGKQYEMAFAIGAKVSSNFGAAFRSAAQQVQSLQTTIDQLNKRQSDISSYQKTATAIDKVRQKLQLYQQQYANLKQEIDSNGKASAAEQNALLAKGKAIDDQKEKLAQLEAKLQTTGDALQKEGVDLNNLGQASTSTAQEIEELKKEQLDLAQSSQDAGDGVQNMAESLMDVMAAMGVIDVLKDIGQAFKECAEESISFENSMASVKRTVGGDDNFINQLGTDFKQMSTEIPITTGELAQIATTAGQLGIAQDRVEEFTTVMAKLATTTDLTADDAATMLAQFSNVTGLTDYERLGAAIAQLGDSTATTASKIVQMSQGMAASASLAGMKPTDILAISAAVGSLGIEAQAGSTAMSTLINNIYKATETGEKLEDYARVAGMTGEQFKRAWAEDAAGALNEFIQGLNDVERNGKSAIVLLDELGINNVRQTKAILGLASAGDLLTNTLAQSNQAWDANTALDEKAGIMYDTTQAKITMLENAFSNLKISIGDAFTGVIKDGAEALTGIVQPISEFIEMNPALVQGIGAAVAVMGGLTAAMVAYTAATKLAAAASAALTAAIPGAKALLIGGLAISALIGGFVALGNALQQGKEEAVALDVEYQQLMNDINQQQHIVDLCNQYEELSNRVDHAVDVSKKMEDFQDVDISLTAQATADVKPEDFLEDENNIISLNGEPGAKIDGATLVVEGTDQIPLDGEVGDQLEAEKLMKSTGVVLHVNPVDESLKLDADAFVKGREIQFTATWANKDDMLADIANMKSEAQIAQEAYTNAKTQLEDMETHEKELVAQLEHAPTQMTKDSLSSQIEATRAAIEDQRKEVEKLGTEYETAAGKYLIAEQAADTLASADAELARIQGELGISSQGAVGGIEAETEAINAQVKAKKALAEAELAGKRAKIYANVGEQAKQYATEEGSLKRVNKAYEDYQRRQQKANEWAGKSAAELNAYYQRQIEYLEAADKTGITNNDYYRQAAEDVVDMYVTMNKGAVNLTAGGKSSVEAWKQNKEIIKGAKYECQTTAEYVGNAADNVARMGEQVGYANERQAAFIQMMAEGVYTNAITIEEAETLVNAAFADTENGAEIAKGAIDQIKTSVDEMKAAAAGANDDEALTALQAKTQPIIDKINELSEAYTNAYNAAYNSISGQMELFEEMKLAEASEDPQGTVDNWIKALHSQEEYVTQYTENLKTAAEMGVNEGLLKQLSDGSEQSAQILADLVAGGADKIDELNQAFSSVEEGKKAFADNIAEMQTNFTKQMQQYKQELETTVAAMNQSEQAAEYGASTVESFAAAAAGKVGDVSSAFAKLSAAATIKASIKMPSLSETFLSLLGFASGTPSAPPGYAIVGEEGPELVKLRGGEQILNADDTAKALDNSYESAEPVSALQGSSAGSNIYTIDFKPQYNITGSMNADELRAVLEEQTGDLRGQMEEMLNDIENDRKRRMYA